MTSPSAQAGAGRGPGRPRIEELDGRIIDATLALIDAGDEVTVTGVVARSGASRAAVYRRWPSLTTLIAEALDTGRTVPPKLRPDTDLREALLTQLIGEDATFAGLVERRFRQRIRLVMADPALQRAYWTAHVAHRRAPLENALRAGVARGELRATLDIEACVDAIAGIVYYQLVARGDALADPSTRVRLRAAFDVLWRGMIA